MIFPSHTFGLPTDEWTLPQALKDAGYDTLMIGKWHLGHADRKYWPQNRGFDHFYGNVMGEVDYFTKERGGVIDWQRDGTFLKEDGYYTTLIGDRHPRRGGGRLRALCQLVAHERLDAGIEDVIEALEVVPVLLDHAITQGKDVEGHQRRSLRGSSLTAPRTPAPRRSGACR